MKNKSFWGTLIAVALTAALAAAVCYLLYRYREEVKALTALLKDKGKRMLASCCGCCCEDESDGDFADI